MLNINWRKLFDRMQPQTLQISAMLLYLNGFFALIGMIDATNDLGYLRSRYSFGLIIGLVVVALHVLSGVFMANDLKLGYRFAIAVAFSPFVLRFWAYSDIERIGDYKIGIYDKLSGRSTLNLIFDVALCALILHPQSRSHQKIWYH